MAVSLKVLNGVLAQALDEFFVREADALVTNVSERNSCGRLALYLEGAAHKAGLTGYVADPEYNRKQGGKVKTILDRDMKVISISCDLILHSRGAQIAEDNLIAIEMKKVERPIREKDSDRDRLRALTKSPQDNIWSYDGAVHPEHVCGYRLGVFVEISASQRTATLEYFTKGAHSHNEQRTF